MQCVDLERYLEAFLDGRIGRTRTNVLRRHLVGCASCRLRLDRLRHFERDVTRRVVSLSGEPSLWTGLDLDLVRTGSASGSDAPLLMQLARPVATSVAVRRPPPPPGRPAMTLRPVRRFGRLLIGAALVLATAGGTLVAGRLALRPNDRASAELRLYLDELSGSQALAMAGSTELAAAWRERVGDDELLPSAPAGFELRGGRPALLAGSPGLVLVYDHGDSATLVYVERAERSALLASGTPDREGGLTRQRWQHGPAAYTLLSSLSPSEVEGFAATAID